MAAISRIVHSVTTRTLAAVTRGSVADVARGR
jgi:hypothetical protein